MRRIVSIWLPSFALERLHRDEPRAIPSAAPFVLAATEGNRQLVSAANPAAFAAGIRPGQGLADARAIAPGLISRPAEPQRDAATLARLSRWTVRYGPAFNTDGADGLWVDVSGVARLFGGEAALLADLERRLARLGFTARLGLADGLGAASALAQFGGVDAGARGGSRPLPHPIAPPGQSRHALAGLPVEALRLDESTARLLRRLGLKRLGQLYALPRAALERRFRSRTEAEAVLTRLDQALGAKREPLRPMRIPPEHVVGAVFPEPLISHEGLEAALDSLARELAASLAAAHRGARRLLLTLHRSDGTRWSVRAGLSRPSRSAPHIVRLLCGKLADADAGFGIDLMQLAATATEALSPAQARLSGGSETGHTDEEALAALIDRLAGRLGSARLLRLGPFASHLPERAESFVPALAGTQAPAYPPPAGIAPRPPLLLPAPEPVSVVAEVPEGPPQLLRWRGTLRRVLRAEGPERILSEWWREIGAEPSGSRDYYRIEDETGLRLWLFREDPAGEGEGRPPAWYLHGLFG